MVASHRPSTGDLVRNPGMCPDWEWNQRPFGSQAGAQSAEPHQPGLKNFFLMPKGKNSIGNVEAKELISMTHGHELQWGNVGGRGWAGWGGVKGGNGTTVIA